MSDPHPSTESSAKVVRVSRSGGRAILSIAGKYFSVNLADKAVSELSSLKEGLAGDSWRVGLDSDQALVASVFNPADGGVYVEPQSRYAFDDDDETEYMALGPDERSALIDMLLRLNRSSGTAEAWTPDGFEPYLEDDEDIERFEYPYIVPVDPDTAKAIAQWLDDDPGALYDPTDADPEEQYLFDDAADDLDYDEMDRYFALIADASGYTPAERSLNARRQMRGFNGRFGGRQVEQTSELKAFRKGKLADKLPIILFPAKVIAEWLASLAPVTAAAGDSQNIAQPSPDPVPKAQTGHDKTKEFVGEQPEQQEQASGPSGDALYFAIVDAADSTAVLEAVAITKGSDGKAQAWRRTKGEWKLDEDTLADLTGATPPPVVQLPTDDITKTVLQQIDASDANPDAFPTDAVPNEAPPAPLKASADVQTVIDLRNAVAEFDTVSPDFQQERRLYLRRRAKAFNRMDLIPEQWRELSAEDMDFLSQATLTGPYGEVLTASASQHPFDGMRGAARLKHYWTFGRGAAKIRWGTPGDLTRAHRHLAKFVGPERAWGLAQNYHQTVFGVSNTKHDKATGQYHKR